MISSWATTESTLNRGGRAYGLSSASRLSIFLSYLLRHAPQAAGLDMAPHGWVSVTQLIQRVNATGKYRLDRAALEESVIADDKGRFLFGANRGQVWTGLRNPQRFECVRKE